jgi:N-acetyl-anhydromuramyl-L-alanine amidase AmpD
VTQYHLTTDCEPRTRPLAEQPKVVLVCHHAAGTDLDYALSLFDPGPPRTVSCTICIDNDGTAVGVVPTQLRPWTTGNPVDNIAITIEVINSEIVGDPTKAESYKISDASYATIDKLVKWMDATYPGFAIDREHIRQHRDYTNTLCPGDLSVNRIITTAGGTV